MKDKRLLIWFVVGLLVLGELENLMLGWDGSWNFKRGVLDLFVVISWNVAYGLGKKHG